MQNDPDHLDLLPRMSPVEEPESFPGVPAAVHRFARSMVLAVIMAPVLSFAAYILLFFCAVAFAMTFGDFPWHQSEVLLEAGNFMVQQDPAFRVQDHDATIRWVGGRKGAWEIYFTHRITRERRCLRWINGGFLYGYSFEEIDCPAVIDGPSG